MKNESINDLLVYAELELYTNRIEQTLDHLNRHYIGAEHVIRAMDIPDDAKEKAKMRIRQIGQSCELAQLCLGWLKEDIKSPF